MRATTLACVERAGDERAGVERDAAVGSTRRHGGAVRAGEGRWGKPAARGGSYLRYQSGGGARSTLGGANRGKLGAAGGFELGLTRTLRRVVPCRSFPPAMHPALLEYTSR